MKRHLSSLFLILLIQIGLVAAVYWPATNNRAAAQIAMLPFPLQQVNTIYVGDEFDNETVLSKVGDRWLLPEPGNLPADNAMIEKLLDAVATREGDWPVADSIAARQRFRVASYHYRRRISFLENENLLGTLLLGTSPGFRKIHARNENQDAIYSIPFNAVDAPGYHGGWLDKKLLQTRAPVSIIADTYSLQREGDGWRSGMGQVPEERELQALLTTLRDLQITGIASGDAQRDLAEAEADLVLLIASLAGETTLELFHQGGEYYIHSSEYPLFFTLSAYDYDRLAGIDIQRVSGAQGQ